MLILFTVVPDKSLKLYRSSYAVRSAITATLSLYVVLFSHKTEAEKRTSKITSHCPVRLSESKTQAAHCTASDDVNKE